MQINKSRLYLLLTGVLFLFPILNLALRNVSIIIWIIFTVFYIVSNKDNKPKRSLQESIPTIFSVLFFLFIIPSLFYTENIKQGLFSLEKSLTILLLPFLAFLAPFRFEERHKHLFINIFVFSNLIFLLYSATVFLIKYNPEFQWENTEIATVHFRYLLSNKIVGVHPTYQALWFFFSALSCFYFILLKKDTNITMRYFYALLFLTFVSWGAFLASRTPLIAFVITIFIVTLYSGIIHRAFKVVIFLVIILGVFFLSTLPTVKTRIKEVMETKIAVPKGDNHNSVNLRVGILKCTTSVIKQNWFLGVGAGDVQDELDTCYKSYNSNAFIDTHYSTHNQYLHSWLAGGIAQLLCLIGIIISCGLLAGKNDNYLLLMFIIFISICFLTENTLERNNGILFFSLMISIIGIGDRKNIRVKSIQ